MDDAQRSVQLIEAMEADTQNASTSPTGASGVGVGLGAGVGGVGVAGVARVASVGLFDEHEIRIDLKKLSIVVNALQTLHSLPNMRVLFSVLS